jgi:Ca2+-binding EF-hand superfamily protein
MAARPRAQTPPRRLDRDPPPLPAQHEVTRLQARSKVMALKGKYKSVFQSKDADQSGSLSRPEVEALLADEGVKVDKLYLDHLFEVFDTDQSGDISLQEFTILYKLLLAPAHKRDGADDGDGDGDVEDQGTNALVKDTLRESMQEGLQDCSHRNETRAEQVHIHMLFKKYDENQTGALSRVNVRNMFATEGMHVADSMLFDDMWRAFDVDGSGTIDRKEFTALYRMMATHKQRQQPPRSRVFRFCQKLGLTLAICMFFFFLLVLLAGLTSCDTPAHAQTSESLRRALQAGSNSTPAGVVCVPSPGLARRCEQHTSSAACVAAAGCGWRASQQVGTAQRMECQPLATAQSCVPSAAGLCDATEGCVVANATASALPPGCRPGPQPTPRKLVISECGDKKSNGMHEFHCYYGGACKDVAPATCTFSGDPHYTSFDGARFDFMGYGYYWAVDSPSLKIQVLIKPCNGYKPDVPVGCTKEVAVWINMTEYPGRTPVTLTTVQQGNINIKIGNHKILVNVRSSKSADSASIKLPGSFYRRVTGLCGNFDGNRDNDLRGAVDHGYRYAPKWWNPSNIPAQAPPPMPTAHPTNAAAPWRKTGPCISSPYRCVDLDPTWLVDRADNLFPDSYVNTKTNYNHPGPGYSSNLPVPAPATQSPLSICNSFVAAAAVANTATSDPTDCLAQVPAENCKGQCTRRPGDTGPALTGSMSLVECWGRTPAVAAACAHAGL